MANVEYNAANIYRLARRDPAEGSKLLGIIISDLGGPTLTRGCAGRLRVPDRCRPAVEALALPPAGAAAETETTLRSWYKTYDCERY